MRTLTTLLVSFLAVVAPRAASSQAVVVGAVAGTVESRQLRERDEDSRPSKGLTAGVFVEVQTPAPLLAVLAEARYAQRGGRFPLLNGTEGDVQADYLVATLAPTVRFAVGPVALFAYGGPSMELTVRTRSAAELANAYADPASQVFAVTAGGGLELRIPGWSVRGEARIVEQLSSAYRGDVRSLRHRATEVVVKVGRRAGAGLPRP